MILVLFKWYISQESKEGRGWQSHFFIHGHLYHHPLSSSHQSHWVASNTDVTITMDQLNAITLQNCHHLHLLQAICHCVITTSHTITIPSFMSSSPLHLLSEHHTRTIRTSHISCYHHRVWFNGYLNFDLIGPSSVPELSEKDFKNLLCTLNFAVINYIKFT